MSRSFSWLYLLALSLVWPIGQTAASEITLMLAPNDPSRPSYQQLCTEFNSSHPDIHLRIILSDISQKLYLLTAADALPDLVPLPHFQLIDYHDQLLDLDSQLDTIPQDRDQFYPSIIQQCRYLGHLKILPNFFNVPLLYYRPDLFRAAGVAYPNSQWTWERYRSAARRLTRRDKDGRVEIWGTNLEQGWWVEWLGIIRQAGGDLMDDHGRVEIGSPATVTALRFLHSLIYQDQSAPLPSQAPAGGFLSGKYAMECGGHMDEWLVLRKEMPFEWDIAPLPAGPAGHVTGEFAVAGIGIWKHCHDLEAAWQVLKFLCGREAGIVLCRAGRPPVRRDVADAAYFNFDRTDPHQAEPAHRDALIDTLAFARSTPKDKNFSPLALNYVNPLLQRALANPDDSDIPAIVAQMQNDCDGYIATANQKPRANVVYFIIEIAFAVAAAVLTIFWLVRRSKSAASTRDGVNRYFIAFISPWIAGMALIVLAPMALSLYWSNTDYNIVDPPQFVGIAQYKSLLTQDPYFWHSLRISFLYALIAVPSTLVLALTTALLLCRASPGIGIFRTLFYLPSIFPVAASGIMWAWLLSPQWGLLNRLLLIFGIHGPGWLYDPHWALVSLVIIGLWSFGAPMVIFLAGLKNIPASYYEAVAIDGASVLRQFWHVTLPMLSPIIFFNLTMGIIGALQIFDIAYVVGSAGPGIGEPQKSTYFYVLNLFDKAFINLNIGVGSAMAWILFAIILAITVGNFALKRFWVFSDGAA